MLAHPLVTEPFATPLMTARAWCFTVNNPEDDWKLESDKIKIGIWQKEIGESGTVHIQGYVEMCMPMRRRGLTRIKGLERAFLDSRKGTRLQAIEYVVKDDGRVSGPFSYGVENLDDFLLNLRATRKTPKKGEERLLAIKEQLDKGATSAEIAELDFPLWVRYYRAFEKYTCLKTIPRSTIADVIVIQGPTGTGKSRYAFDTYPGAYWKQRSNWWDGYIGESVCILDEFYGWLPFDLLLRLCDRYPMLVETKGGQTQMIAQTIVFTTNKNPRDWYKDGYWAALERRITKFICIPSQNNIKIFDSFNEALPHFK